MKSLKEENRKLREEKMAESLSSQAIIESLEELVHEQKEDHEIMMQKILNEVKDFDVKLLELLMSLMLDDRVKWKCILSWKLNNQLTERDYWLIHYLDLVKAN